MPFYNALEGGAPIRVLRGIAAAAALALAGCGSYSEFTLPAPGGEARDLRYDVSADADPVLVRGGAGEFDAVDALNPSVVWHAGGYFNFYSGFDGHTWRTGLATSGDGLTWRRKGSVLSPDPSTWEGDYIAANGTALFRGGEFLYWYQAGGRNPRIGLARSPDGLKWTKEPRPVLELGPRGSWDERAVADPYVILAGGRFYMYYLGQDRARRQRLGVAMSRDGVRWTKLRRNPVLELGEPGTFDENGLGEPAVWTEAGWYWMLYTGRDREENRKIGLARSNDGVRWERVSRDAFFAGGEAWNSKVVCDPTVDVREGEVRVWYGGGDVPRPDERLNGQIGVFEMKAAQ